MEKTQRANILKLADYLDSLPEDYEHFDMKYFSHNLGTYTVGAPFTMEKDITLCGTVACMAGHGPMAGLTVPEGLSGDDINEWHEYMDVFFGEAAQAKGFLFGGGWVFVDNTLQGAAARARFYLDQGVPSFYRETEPAMEAAKKLYAPYLKVEKS